MSEYNSLQNSTQAKPVFVWLCAGIKAFYFTGALTRLSKPTGHPVAAYIIHGDTSFLHTAAT